MLRMTFAKTYGQLPDEMDMNHINADGATEKGTLKIKVQKNRLHWYEHALIIVGAIVVARGVYLMITKK